MPSDQAHAATIHPEVDALAAARRRYEAAAGDRAVTPAGAPGTSDWTAQGLVYQQLKSANAAALAINRALGRIAIEVMPGAVQINNIGFCNLRCPQCATHGSDAAHARYQSPDWTMSREDIARFAASSFAWAGQVSLSGIGEGLLHRDIDVIIDLANAHGCHFYINTNGTTMLAKRLRRLVGIADIHASIDGATPVVFEGIRRGAKYGPVMRNILVAARAIALLPPALRSPVVLNYGICGSNLRNLPTLVELAHFLGVGRIVAYPMAELPEAIADDVLTNFPAAYRHYHALAHARAAELGVQIVFPMAPRQDVAPDPHVELRGKRVIVPDPDERENAPHPPFERWIDTAGVDDDAAAFAASVLAAAAERHEDPRWRDPQAIADAQRLVEREIRRIGLQIMALSPDDRARIDGMGRSTRPRRFCESLHRLLYVDARGAAAPCCVLHEHLPIGDARTESPRALFNGTKLADIIAQNEGPTPYPGCAKCPSLLTIPENLLEQLTMGGSA
jgi:MoaA/NifB/PqqE/SkfB family radical SAM enzyme